MAQAEVEASTQIITVTEDQCGYCLELGSRRVNPRTLPCGHSFCLLCLQNDFAIINAVRCPVCRRFLPADTDLEKLPEAGSESSVLEVESLFCTTCDNQSKRREAEVFCKRCDEAYCKDHNKVHQGLLPTHGTITPAEWLELKPVRDSMFCEDHKRYPVTTGCKLCWRICCNICLSNETNQPCSRTGNGIQTTHRFDALQNLACQAKYEVRDTLGTLQLKKDELDELEKEFGRIIEVMETSKEQTIAELESAREKQVARLTDAIESINISHNKMKEKFLDRMHQIQAQTEAYATLVTQVQAQIDRGIEEGKKIHHCKSDADVMRRQAGLSWAADSLHNITVPLTLDVNNCLKLSEKVNKHPLELSVELQETPLTLYLKEADLELNHITVRTNAPKELKFSHLASLTWLNYEFEIPENCLHYTEDGKLVGYYSDSYLEIVTTMNQRQIGGCDIASPVEQLQLAARQKLMVYALHSSGANCMTVLVSKNNCSSTSLGLIESVSLVRDSVPFPTINYFALFDNEVVLCKSETLPQLYVWNSETDERRQAPINFEESTKISSILSGPDRSVLCLCKEVINNQTTKTWYEPEVKPELQQPKSSLALVDIDSGAVLWQRFRKCDELSLSTKVSYFDGFFYILHLGGYPTYEAKVEIVDALYGTTVLEPVDVLSLEKWVSIQDCQVVNVDGEKKKLMIRDSKNKIHVLNLIY